MKLSYKHQFILLWFCCSIGATYASDSAKLSWERLALAGKKAVKEGRLNDAERIYTRALMLAPHKAGEPRYTESLRALADVYWATNQFSKAEVLYHRELSVLESYGKNYADMLHDLFRLGLINDRKGEFQKSEAFYRRALLIAKKNVLSPDDPRVFDILANLCVVYYALGDPKQAEITAEEAGQSLPKSNFQKKAATLCERALQLQNRSASGQAVYGKDAHGKEPFNKAAELLSAQALSICRRSFGSESLPVSECLETVGDLKFAQGKLTEAESNYKAALTIKERFSGPDNQIAECRLKLADLYYTLANYGECAKLCQEAVSSYAQSAALYPRMTNMLTKLCDTYVAQKKYSQAEPFFKDILVICEKQYGRYSPDLLGPLYATALNDLNQLKSQECKTICNRALELYRKTSRADDRQLTAFLVMPADIYRSEKNYRQSEALTRKVVGIFEKLHHGAKPFDLPNALYALAEICSLQGKYKEAESLYARAYANFEKLPNYDRLELCKIMFQMAANYRLQKKFVRAEPLYNRILTTYKNVLGLEHQGVVGALCAMADNLRDQGKYRQADSLYRQALAVCEKIHGGEHPAVSEVLRALADNCLGQGDVEAAKQFTGRAEKILFSWAKSCEAQKTDLTKTLCILAERYTDQGKYKEAERLYKQALLVYGKIPNYDRLERGKIQFKLAMNYRLEKQFTDAENLYKEIIATYQKVLGPEHSDMAGILNAMGDNLAAQGKDKEAEALYDQALTLYKKAHGTESAVAVALYACAERYSAQGKYQEAAPLYLQALQELEKIPNYDSVELCKVRFKLSTNYSLQNEFQEAEQALRQNLATYKKSPGYQSPEVAGTLSAIADTLYAQNKWVEAEPLYLESLSVFGKLYGAENPLVATARAGLAEKCSRAGNYQKAEALYLETVSIYEKIPDFDTTELGRIRLKLAKNYQSQKRFVDAQAIYQKVLESYERQAGSETPECAGIINAMADNFWLQGKYAEAEALYTKALAVFKKSLGTDHPTVSAALSGPADKYAAGRILDNFWKRLGQISTVDCVE